uniref:Glycosyltransferase family 92 protein n=1 Tax=Rhabditophanes sp. KR3021 TaxID=114890 RepID=A0AC35THT7_9BILA
MSNSLNSAFITFSHSIYLVGEKNATFKIECATKECPSPHSPEFKIWSFIGTLKHLKIKNSKRSEDISIYSSRSNRTLRLPVMNVIKPTKFKKYKYTLGVCIQPMYNYYNYLELIQFFETWIRNGASIFYFYKNSISRDVQTVLKHYSKITKVHIIEWSSLPKFNKYDPNRHAKRFLVNTAMIDCLYKARYVVKYISQTDLDEVVAINYKKHQTLIKFLDKLSKHSNNSISTFCFLSRNAKIYKHWTSIRDMKKIKFNNFKVAKLSVPFKPTVYSKLIFRPDLIFNFYAHGHLKTETGRITQKYFHGYNVELEDGAIHHFRAVFKLPEPTMSKTKYYNFHIKHLNSQLIKLYPRIKAVTDKFSTCIYMYFLLRKFLDILVWSIDKEELFFK